MMMGTWLLREEVGSGRLREAGDREKARRALLQLVEISEMHAGVAYTVANCLFHVCSTQTHEYSHEIIIQLHPHRFLATHLITHGSPTMPLMNGRLKLQRITIVACHVKLNM